MFFYRYFRVHLLILSPLFTGKQIKTGGECCYTFKRNTWSPSSVQSRDSVPSYWTSQTVGILKNICLIFKIIFLTLLSWKGCPNRRNVQWFRCICIFINKNYSSSAAPVWKIRVGESTLDFMMCQCSPFTKSKKGVNLIIICLLQIERTVNFPIGLSIPAFPSCLFLSFHFTYHP